MKLAWLCYGNYHYLDSEDDVEIVFQEPDQDYYKKVVPIVYEEIESNE